MSFIFNIFWNGGGGGWCMSPGLFEFLIAAYSSLKSVRKIYDFSYVSTNFRTKSDYFFEGWPPWGPQSMSSVTKQNQTYVLNLTPNFNIIIWNYYEN